MEGVSAENNEIYLELTSENLSRALKTAQNAKALKIKLTNKHFPCLTISVELVSKNEVSEISWKGLDLEEMQGVTSLSFLTVLLKANWFGLNLFSVGCSILVVLK
jgi:hypothetical protein